MKRRDFIRTGMMGAPALAIRTARAATQSPNVLFIVADQLSMDAITAHGNRFARTPNIDRLARAGVSFRDSYTTYPLCSPARSSMFTGRMPSETGVITNGLPIRKEIPNVGQWLGSRGYDTVYAGKWHVPDGYSSNIPGFTVLPGGLTGQGHMGDAAVSRACQSYLHNRSSQSPFLMVASLLQPHDICAWVSSHERPAEWEKMARISGPMPPLPTNFEYDRREPGAMHSQRRPNWNEQQWRYYLWSYYHHVEMVDAEIGRILNAVEDTGRAKNTVIIMTSDHGEGSGHHHMVLKNYLYDEAARVPLFVSWPGETPAGKQDTAHLASGLDITPTICDYAGVPAPDGVVGRSLRPLVEGRNVPWRDMVAAEVARGGRMIRTKDCKYIVYPNDPVEQLFDWKSDSGETRNVASDSSYTRALDDHRRLLKDWEGRLELAPNAIQARAKG
ncbi:MAG: sulfatase-like hydrolase/transferase [Acidobacteria bacterium]|nr:sulfatase-like hydrolase/transferase [Acidobacteriota bacterium]